MSMSVCNAVSRTQFTRNPCHARYGAFELKPLTIRPFQFGRPPRAPFREGQRTATRTMSACAASATVAALMDGPNSLVKARNDSGPRLLEINAGMFFLASARAKPPPNLPDPMMPYQRHDDLASLGS
jgi:hypothetical protein